VTIAGRLPATMFAVPADQATIIARPRLFDALDAGTEGPLTLVSAPPGAGKTVLLASWIGAGRPPGPVAWLSLDAANAERRPFWHAVLEALSRAGAGDAVTALAGRSHRRVERLVAALAAALDDRAEPIVLVLDDFRDAGPAAHADLDQLLQHPPAALRVVIATRADPPMRLARLRMQDRLAEIRQPALAMTLAEAGEMLAAVGLSLDADDLRRLWQHTEGWAGALRLAALSLRGHPDPGRFVADFAGDDRAISDYLISEVTSRASPEERRMLLRTSVVGVLNGDLANALTGGTDGSRRLAELAASGALLMPLDRRDDWFRYHALFRELLQAELRSESPELVPELHRRAAEWFAGHGEDAQALLHAVEAADWELAARLAGDRWVDLLIRGESGVLRPLVERLPAEVVVEEPEVALAISSALLDRGDQAEAARLLERAAAGADRVPAGRRTRFDVSLCALQLYVERLRGDLDTALRTGRALAAAGRLDRDAVDADLRALALLHLGIAELWTGALDAAGAHLEQARTVAAEARHDWLVLMAGAHLALLAATTHDYVRAARRAGDALGLAERSGWERTWPAGAACLALAAAEFLWHRGDDAGRTLERAREALAFTQERPLRAGLALLDAEMLAARGELEPALAVLRAGAEELGDFPLLAAVRGHFTTREAVLRARLGEREAALRLVAGDSGTGTPRTLEAAVVLAQLQLAEGESAAARATVGAWSARLDAEQTPSAVQGWIVDALALEAAADHDGAAASLERALDRAEPAGLRWALLAFGRPLHPLLHRQLRCGTAHRALVGELLRALDATNGRSRSAAPLVVEPLSPRERAVLRYLPTMMSNQEIASELFVSVNTVKTHLKAIYRKLDVANRREAVERARTLELLAP
jgi:LuxR family maltose regulon positive regulatory protein